MTKQGLEYSAAAVVQNRAKRIIARSGTRQSLASQPGIIPAASVS
jgi:hypothetical protein